MPHFVRVQIKMFENQCYFVQVILWIVLLCSPQSETIIMYTLDVITVLCIYAALATSCQVYPSEYAYLDSSVTRFEREIANCRVYLPMGLALSVKAEDYTHCNGVQLRLADSVLGSEQYTTSHYYVWNVSPSSQLLFIFPTRVNLTTITLHYYSDNLRGLPGLRFYAVPDDFEVWEALVSSYKYEDVLPEEPNEELANRSNISINFPPLKCQKGSHVQG